MNKQMNVHSPYPELFSI